MSEKRVLHILDGSRPTKAWRRGYKAGMAWSDSGRSFYDLEAVWAGGWLAPEVVDLFDEGEVERLDAHSAPYLEGWMDGVHATYTRIRQAFGTKSTGPDSHER